MGVLNLVKIQSGVNCEHLIKNSVSV